MSITNILNNINNSFTNIHHIPYADQTNLEKFNENIINNNKSTATATTTTNSDTQTNNTNPTINNDQVNLNQNHIILDKNNQNGKVPS
jgi:hypothetical protein